MVLKVINTALNFEAKKYCYCNVLTVLLFEHSHRDVYLFDFIVAIVVSAMARSNEHKIGNSIKLEAVIKVLLDCKHKENRK